MYQSHATLCPTTGSVRSTQNSDKYKPHSENDVKHKTEPGLDDGIQLGEEGCQAFLPVRNARVTHQRVVVQISELISAKCCLNMTPTSNT